MRSTIDAAPMATHRFAIDRVRDWPFLTLRRLTEEDVAVASDIELDGDEIEVYEQSVRSWGRWQKRLSEVDLGGEPEKDTPA